MTVPAPEPVFFRIEKGDPDPVELGALAAVLFGRMMTAGEHADRPAPATALWRRPERLTGFVGPRTWQHGPR